MTRVWYVAYGSNLSSARFRCYVAGGIPVGGSRAYVGCRDTRAPSDTVSIEPPGGLRFTGNSTVWGGGMAIYDSKLSGRAACRAYLVTSEQFADVVAQETRRRPGGAFARQLERLLARFQSTLVFGPGRYETLLKVGMRRGFPMITITQDSVPRTAVASPGAAYLRCISVGLNEAHGWDRRQIADYLTTARGVDLRWTWDELSLLAQDSLVGRLRPDDLGQTPSATGTPAALWHR
jgi:hypothetical protein